MSKFWQYQKLGKNFQNILGPEVKSWMVGLGWNFWSLLTRKPGSGSKYTGIQPLLLKVYVLESLIRGTKSRNQWSEQQCYDLFWQNFLMCGTNKSINSQPLICKCT